MPILGLFVNTCWFVSSVICRFKYGVQSVKRIDENNSSFVVFSPHSDDESIGAFSLLRKSKEKSTVLYFNKYGSNHNPDNIQTRDAEIRAMCLRLGTRLVEYVKVQSIDFETVDYILLPSPFDWHEEHLEILRYSLPTIRSDSKILLYEETVPLPKALVSHFIPLNKEQTLEKWSEIKINYQSQRNLPWKRFFYNNIANVNIKGVYAAEVFCMIDKESVLKMIQFREKNNEKFGRLRHLLNKPVFLRKECNRLYDEYKRFFS